MDNDDIHQYILPIILLGDSGVGKTHILDRYLNGENPSEIEKTYGIEQKCKEFTDKKNQILVKILDASGKKKYQSSINKSRANVFGGFIIYDISNSDSFKHVDKWVEIFKNISAENATLMLLGNKSDLDKKRVIKKEEGKRKADQYKMFFKETSVLEEKIIKKAFKKLLTNIFDKVKNNSMKVNDEEEMDVNMIEEKSNESKEETDDNDSDNYSQEQESDEETENNGVKSNLHEQENNGKIDNTENYERNQIINSEIGNGDQNNNFEEQQKKKKKCDHCCN